MTAVRRRAPTRGSKPGERRGGRQKGTPNKATADVKALIDSTGDMALIVRGLFDIAIDGESEAGRVAASKELLDRRFGKATQPIAGDDSMAAIRTALSVGFVSVTKGNG